MDQGVQKQYEEMQKIIRENKYILPEIIIKNKVAINGRDFKDKKWIFSKEIECKNK